jgi:hypothetical protein
MAVDENMAISFYKTGDKEDLAAQLIELLDSPERQRQAAEKNYSAAIRMTMPHVVRHYLRWFELEKRKQTLNSSRRRRLMDRWRSRSFRPSMHGLPPDALAEWTMRGLSEEDSTAPENVVPSPKERDAFQRPRTER